MAKRNRPAKRSPPQPPSPARPGHDPRPFLIACIAVGMTVILTGGGITLLTLAERQVPTALIALGSNALGMLGGLLVPRPHSWPH